MFGAAENYGLVVEGRNEISGFFENSFKIDSRTSMLQMCSSDKQIGIE